ncbi:MAG: flagellin [Planctomycetota bacterium]|nr:flagellin [Planctomycetota bacterium]
MSRINTNVPSLLAQRVLGMQNKSLVTSLERLSTGLRINRGADDPAGLIASENLRAEKTAISAAISNAERAEQVANVAEGGLQEISSMLLELQSLVGSTANDAGISAEEKDANQLQVDSILQTIDRVANSTSFNGTKLLNGNFDYTTSNVATGLEDVSIQSARLSDASGSYINVTIDVTTSAQTGAVYLSTQGTLVNGDNGSITVEITGMDGVQQFTFASGTTQANIIDAINTFSDALGVSATQAVTDTDKVEINSRTYGSDQYVRIKVLEGTSNTLIADADSTTDGTKTDYKDYGRDAVVLINGNAATTDGLTARVATDGFDVTITLDGDLASGSGGINTTGGSSTFQITGGGADFNLAPKVNLAGKVSLGIETSTTGNLGDDIDGFLSALKSGGTANVVNGDLTKAQKIVDNAIRQVSSLRGRLGAFTKNTVGSTINNLGVTLENTAAAESVIRDADFAVETAALTRQQIMTQAATQALSIANVQPQQVLSLLG